MCISNSMALSNDQIQEVLLNFLEGELSLQSLQKKFKGRMVINFHPENRTRELIFKKIDQNFSIPVKNSHLRRILEKYLSGEMSTREVSDWAAFISLSSFYSPDGETEEAQWDAGEDVLWIIMQELASPFSIEKVDVEIAKKYLEQLN